MIPEEIQQLRRCIEDLARLDFGNSNLDRIIRRLTNVQHKLYMKCIRLERDLQSATTRPRETKADSST
jgi:predicted RNase H-like nuclease (RuvC/YqgF family)